MNDSSPQSAPPSTGRVASGRRSSALALLVAIAALALASWQWYDASTRTGELRRDVSERLAAADTQTREGRNFVEQGRETMAEMRAKISVLESRLAESQKQQAALDGLYQELSRNRDEWAYAEIEQSLFVASQQLQLAGNTKSALIALQSADSRLQQLDRPQLVAVRKAINRDIERLKAAPQLDIVALSVRLDGALAQADRLPLVMDARPRPEQPAAEQEAK